MTSAGPNNGNGSVGHSNNGYGNGGYGNGGYGNGGYGGLSRHNSVASMISSQLQQNIMPHHSVSK